MSKQAALSSQDIQAIRSHVERALELAESGSDPSELLPSLRECRELLSAIADSQSVVDETRHDGSIEHTFEDESYEPYGRELDVRIYFDWDDYNSNDAPATTWGARVTEIEVLGVRYFDQQGNVISIEEHHLDAAWELFEHDRELIEQRCTESGCRSGIGSANPLYAPSGAGPSVSATASTMRMAPSQRDRNATSGRRKHG